MELDLTAASQAMAARGCSFVSGSAFLAGRLPTECWEHFSRAWEELPADPYITDREPYRFRRHARVVFDPNICTLRILPAAEYMQSAAHNRLFGGVSRQFAPMQWEKVTRQFCTALVELGSTRVLRLEKPTLVNIHQVRILGGAGRTGEPAPEGSHRDGFAYISVHLVSRDVDHGGVTSATEDGGNIRATATLEAPLDAMYVDDRALLHYTSPIGADSRDARRDVLLLSNRNEITSPFG